VPIHLGQLPPTFASAQHIFLQAGMFLSLQTAPTMCPPAHVPVFDPHQHASSPLEGLGHTHSPSSPNFWIPSLDHTKANRIHLNEAVMSMWLNLFKFNFLSGLSLTLTHMTITSTRTEYAIHPTTLELSSKATTALLDSYNFDTNKTIVMDYACGTGSRVHSGSILPLLFCWVVILNFGLFPYQVLSHKTLPHTSVWSQV